MFNKIMDNIKVFFSKGYVITFESGDKGFIPTKGMSFNDKLEIVMSTDWEIELDSGEKLIEKTKYVDFKRRFRVL